MGTEIKRNKKGLYQLKSTISDEVLHTEKWITEDESRKVFIERILWNAIEDIIKVELDFPNAYRINGICEKHDNKGLKFLCEHMKNGDDAIYEKFIEIIKKHKLEEFFEPLFIKDYTEDISKYKTKYNNEYSKEFTIQFIIDNLINRYGTNDEIEIIKQVNKYFDINEENI